MIEIRISGPITDIQISNGPQEDYFYLYMGY